MLWIFGASSERYVRFDAIFDVMTSHESPKSPDSF